MTAHASYSVIADPERDLIRIRLTGFLTPEVMAAFFRSRNEALAKLRCGPNQHAVVADLRDMVIQAQDLIQRFQAMLADPAYRSRRLAVVTPSALVRMQSQRATGNPNVRFFTDPAEAESWALEPGPATGTA